MLNGLDLFSGIGGLSIALAPWVEPIAYCESDRYAQSVLLSRAASGELRCAPIWDDVCTLSAAQIGAMRVDIIYGGFPCQDISVAGNGAGLEGKRSGLVSEIFRLCDELKPTFIFLENVPAIRTRGGERVVKELASRGYDCRWDVVSAAEVGAPHLRKRWFLLAAHAERINLWHEQGRSGGQNGEGATVARNDGEAKPLAHTTSLRGIQGTRRIGQSQGKSENIIPKDWWAIEPDVGRVANGVPSRVDRIRGLGNAVVPLQAREAFERLMGIGKNK